MSIRVEREGNGHLVLVDGQPVQLADAFAVIDEVEAAEPTSAFIVADFAVDANLDLPLDALHSIARRLRVSRRRGRRLAFVVNEGAGVGSTIADFRDMVASLSADWADSPLEIQTFARRDEAVQWADAASE